MNIIHETIEKLKSTSSRTIKSGILNLVSEDVDLQRFLYIIYNPFYNYKLKINPSNIKRNNILTLSIIDFMDFVEEHIDDNDITRKSYDILQYLNYRDIELALMISNRSMSVGVGIKTINKSFNNLIPFIPFDRTKHTEFPMYIWKNKGKFINIIINKSEIIILNKKGIIIKIDDLTLLDELYEVFLHFNRDIVIHAQLSNNIVYMTDILNYIDWVQGKTNQQLKDRIGLLEGIDYLNLIRVKLIDFSIINKPSNNNSRVIKKSLSSKWNAIR